MERFYIVKMIRDTTLPYRVIEKLHTVDGPRDRITNRAFATLIEAEQFIKEQK